jgi:thiopurine S-methyltransferase
MNVNNSFWLDRWSAGQTGWHEADGNALLRQHWSTLGIPQAAAVLVPLCGKARDMAWLAAQGHPVLGVDLSDRAARIFFEENDLDFTVEADAAGQRFAGSGIQIIAGDFLSLPADRLGSVTGFFDRAALIALPPEDRVRYAAHLADGLRPGCRGLLITLAYPQADMSGPPFSVDDAEVRALFGRHFGIELLTERDALSGNDHLRERGVTALVERAYRLERTSD